MNVLKLLMPSLLLLMLLFSCKKELLESIDPSTPTKQENSQAQLSRVSIEQAKSVFQQQLNNEAGYRSGVDSVATDGSARLIWYLAKEVPTSASSSISLVPLEVPPSVANPGFGAQLVFYPGSECEAVEIELVTYQALDTTENAWAAISNKTFTGAIMTYNFCTNALTAFKIQDGQILYSEAFEGTLSLSEAFAEELSNIAGYRTEESFWDSIADWWKRLWRNGGNWNQNRTGNWQGGSASNSDSGSDGGTGTYHHDGTYTPPGNTGFPIYNSGTNGDAGGSNGGGSISINDLFDVEFFEGQGYATQNLLTRMITEQDLFICAEDLYREIFQCLESNAEVIDPHQTNNGQMTIQDYNRELSKQIQNNFSHQCMKDVIEQRQTDIDIDQSNAHLACMATEVRSTLRLYNFSDEEVFELIQQNEDCSTSTAIDLDCVKDQLFQNLNEVMNLDDNETCLQVHSQQLVNVANFYKKHSGANADDCEKNLAAAIGNTFANFYCETGNTSLALGSYDGSANDALAYLMRERLWRALKFALPIAPEVTMNPSLFDNLTSGSWMEVMYQATDLGLGTTNDPCFAASRMSIFSLILAQEAEALAALSQSNVVVALSDFIENYALNLTELELAKLLGSNCISTSNGIGNIDEECVWEYVLPNDGGGFLVSKTCKSSFNYIKVGDGFTAQVIDIRHGYQKGFLIFEYRIPIMCIQVRGKDAFDNPLTIEKAAELSAFAMDNARLEMFEKEIGVTITNGIDAMNSYKLYLKDELGKLTGYKASCSISYGNCFGNIPEAPYRVNPFGAPLCIDIW